MLPSAASGAPVAESFSILDPPSSILDLQIFAADSSLMALIPTTDLLVSFILAPVMNDVTINDREKRMNPPPPAPFKPCPPCPPREPGQAASAMNAGAGPETSHIEITKQTQFESRKPFSHNVEPVSAQGEITKQTQFQKLRDRFPCFLPDPFSLRVLRDFVVTVGDKNCKNAPREETIGVKTLELQRISGVRNASANSASNFLRVATK